MSDLFPGLFEDLLEVGNVNTGGYIEEQPSEPVSSPSSQNLFPGLDDGVQAGSELFKQEDYAPPEEVAPVVETDNSFEQQLAAEEAPAELVELPSAPQEVSPIPQEAQSALAAADAKLPDPVDYSAKIMEAFDTVGKTFEGSGMPTGIANLGKTGAFISQKAGQVLGIKGLEDYGKQYVDFWSQKVKDYSVPELNVSLLDSPMTALDPRFWNYQLGTMVPAMALGGGAVAMGAGPATSAVTSGFSMSAPESIDTYDTVLKETGSEAAAAKAAGSHLMFNTILESAGLLKILKPAGNFIRRTGQGMLTEGGTEFSQTFVSEINQDMWSLTEQGYSLPEIAEIVKPQLGEYLENSASAFVVGAGIGGGMSAATGQKVADSGGVMSADQAAVYLEESLQLDARAREESEAEKFLQREAIIEEHRVASENYVKARNRKGDSERTAARAGLERDVAGYAPDLPRGQRKDWFGQSAELTDPAADAQSMLDADAETAATRLREQDANAEGLQAGVETVLSAQAKQKLNAEGPLRKSAPGQADPVQSPMPKDDIFPGLDLDAQLGFGRTGPEFADVPADKPRTVTPGPELQANLDLMENAKMSLRDKKQSLELGETKLVATPQQVEMAKQDAIDNDYQVQTVSEGSMSPMDFLGLTTRSAKTIETLKKTEFKTDSKGSEETDTGKKFDKAEFEASPSPYVVVNAEGKIIGHEGRHRAIAAQEAGITDFPVAVLYTSEAKPNELEGQYNKDITKDLTEGPSVAPDEPIVDTNAITPVTSKYDVAIAKQKQRVQDSDFDGAEVDKLTELLMKRDNELGVEQVEDTVAEPVAEPVVKPKAPITETKVPDTQTVAYDDNKEAVLTTESPEEILMANEPDEEVIPDTARNKKTERKVIRRTDSIPKGDTKGVQGHPPIIISPKDKVVTQDDILAPVIDAMYLSDADAVVKEINSLPQAKRKAAFKEASRLAVDRNTDVDPDVLATTIEEAQGEIAGRKKLGGQVEMKKDASGMYSGTHPVSGVTYTAIKGPKGYEVKADKEIVATGIKGIDAAMQPIKDHSEAAIGPVYESKPGDADYTKHTERWKVADKNGKVLEGMHSKKAAIAMRESILTGMEYVDPTGTKVTQGAEVQAALKDLGKTNSRKQNVSERQNANGEVRQVEITPELRAQLEARYTKEALAKSRLTDTALIERTIKEQKDQTVGSPDYIEREISDLFEDRIGLDEALDRVIEQTGDEGAFAVGNMLKRVIPVEKLQAVKVRPISESSSTRTGSHYDPKTNTVFYTPLASPQVIVHEAVHGTTVQEMQQLDKDDPIRLEINKTLTALTDYVMENGLISDEQLSLTLTGSETDFRAAMLEAGNTPEGRLMYALRSPEEMFSMVLTDGEVRAVAKRVTVGKGKEAPTAWQKVKTAVKKLLKSSESDYSALDSILDLTYELGQHEIKGRPIQGVFGDFQENLTKAELLGTDKDGVVNGVSAKTKSVIKGLKTAYRKGIRGVDQVLGDIHPDLQAKFAGYSSNVAVKVSNRMEKTVEWSKAVNKLSQADRGRYVVSLLNYHDENYRGEIDRIHKANPELGKEFDKVKAVLNELSDEFVKNGLIAKSRKNYFPNIVEDMQGLMNEAHKGTSHNLIAEVKASLGDNPPDSLVQERMSDYLSRGVYPAMLMKPGSAKAKTLWDVTPELAKFYVDPVSAVANHIRSATESVEQRVLVGKSNQGDLEGQIAKLMEKPKLSETDKARIANLETQLGRHNEELEGSIGKWLAEQAYADQIGPEEQAIVRDVIKSKFNEKAMNKALAAYKAVASATTLGQLNSTLIQVTDFLPSVFRNGLNNTTSALFGKKLMTQDDIDVHSALKDMADQGKAQKMLEISLKMSGFSTLDGMLKRTTMQAAINKAKSMSRDEFVSKYETTFNLPGEATKLYNDIRAGVKSDNARRFAFNALADVQPISSSQMPQWYLDHPNGRMAYSLKTYGVKMINNIHTAGRDAKRDGITFAGKKYEAGNGAAAIAMLPYIFSMTLAGAGADSLKDLIMGREVDFSENVIDSFLKLGFASRYSVANIAKGDLGGVIGDLILPPAGFIEKPIGDIYNYVREDREDTWQTGTMIPLFGKYIHEWYSQEALGKKQRKLRDNIFALNKKISQGDGDSDDRRELREMRMEYNSKVNKEAGEKKITNQSLRNSTRRRKKEEKVKQKEESKGLDLFGAIGDALSPNEAYAGELPEDYEEQRIALGEQLREEATLKKSPMVELLGQDGVEGYEEKIYTPGNDKSGVTVGNGIDFGQQNIAKFRRAGVSEEIIKKATEANLWGAKGDAAKKIVSDFEDKSLFTKAEVAEISNKITDFSAKELARKFGDKWEDMPETNRAVVLSLYHIYGNAWFKHNSYKQALAGDWEGLKKNMEDYKDRTQGLAKGVNNRHKIMSKYIEETA